MTKVRHIRPKVSKMYFLEAARWTVGKDKFTVCIGEEDGPKLPVAYVRLENFDENKKAIFSSRDLDGKPLYENTNNIYELKCKFQDDEIALTKAMQERDERIEQMIDQASLNEPDYGREISMEETQHEPFERFASEHEPEHDTRHDQSSEVRDLGELDWPLGLQQEKNPEAHEEIEEARCSKNKHRGIER